MGTSWDDTVITLQTAIAKDFPRALNDLAALTAIPSISAMPQYSSDVRRSAELVRELCADAGATRAEIWQSGDGHPAVFAHWPAPEGAPTVCLYAHHDIQPVGDESLWSSDPYVMVERDGRLYGRGVGDDKAGIIGHLMALRAFQGHPPVGVKVFVEGEEESGSASIPAILSQHRQDLTADVWIVLDAVNWEQGQPTLTTTLRGLAEVYVTVETSAKALHSGIYGGVVPDAVTVMCKLLATMTDDAGNLAIAGLVDGKAPDLIYPEDRLRRESGILAGVDWIGDGSVVDRLWARHCVAVLAMDVTPVKQASNTLAPTCTAKIGMRVPPGADPVISQQALMSHLQQHVPHGAVVTLVAGETGRPFQAATDGVVATAILDSFKQAWQVDPVFAGGGGSLPLAAMVADVFSDTPVLVTSVLDPDSAMHAPDESVSISDLRHAALAEALMLTRLGLS
ncbi:MAG: M20/M25/M40 family metallo-hydrolase [Propionibacteriaceae bacterium]